MRYLFQKMIKDVKEDFECTPLNPPGKIFKIIKDKFLLLKEINYKFYLKFSREWAMGLPF